MYVDLKERGRASVIRSVREADEGSRPSYS
jgi:hypothetical protein